MKTPEGYVVVPQKITANMVDSASIHSEVGEYILANWAGAVECLNELYQAFIKAAPVVKLSLVDDNLFAEVESGGTVPATLTIDTKRQKTSSPKCFYEDTPTGVFFATFEDLSGATLFTTIDDGTFLNLVDDCYITDRDWFIAAGYFWFINVDQSVEKLARNN